MEGTLNSGGQHRTQDGMNHGHLFPSLRAWKPKIKVSAYWVPGKAFPPGLQMVAVLPCPHTDFSQCRHRGRQ